LFRAKKRRHDALTSERKWMSIRGSIKHSAEPVAQNFKHHRKITVLSHHSHTLPTSANALARSTFKAFDWFLV